MSCYRNQELLLCSVLVSLSLFSLLAATCLGHAKAECLPHQRSLLLIIKLGFSFEYSDADHRLLSWTPGSNCCDWEGISCDPESGLVIGLDLSEYRLTGNLSSSLFSLTSLRTLNLSRNWFQSNLPQWGFENLTELVHLNLSSCGFRSDQILIGISHLTRLISLDLSFNNNQLGNTANFQALIRNLTHLEELHVVDVTFSSNIDWHKTLSISLPRLHVLSLSSGTLPRDFFQLRNWTALYLEEIEMHLLKGFPENSHLEVLTLYASNTSGSLLDSIGNLKYLRELRIWDEGMFPGVRRALPTLTMPSSIWNLIRLVTLDLSSNNLIGTIPSSICNLTRLVKLDLSFNNLIGTIPSSIWNLTRLVTLDLSSNNFIGTIPSSIWNLTRLVTLDLSSNNFIGTIPSSIWNLTRLVQLDLSSNYLTGIVPTSTGNLTQLEYLDLSNNNLNGQIPSFLFSLPAIRTLKLIHNQLSGQLNDSIGISPSLEKINLAGNQLQGQIPLSIFKNSALANLDLSSNNFSGTVELDMFEGLKNLTVLVLSNNMLSVQDVSDYYFHSFPNLQELSLATCNLTKIPAFLRHQDNLQYLDLSNNRINGDIPNWIWTLTNTSFAYLNLSCNSFTNIEGLAGLTLNSFEVLDLHSNMLRGPIPLPISTVWILDYSNNFFSSIIPSNISSYLEVLEFLSFANNSLTGEIPPSICKVSTQEVLDLSDNKLSGFIPPCLFEGDIGITGLNLKGNQLQGIIPQNITKNYLEILNLHGNQLEGSLPRALANCSSLIVLDVGNNNLVDSFPFWLGNITTLRVLVLRGNGFSGPVEIPNSNEANYTFGSLQIFDLSSNHFEGNFPSKCFNNMKVMMNSSQSDSHVIGFPYYLVGLFYQSTIFVTSKGEDITLKKLLSIYTYIDLSNNRFEGNIPDVIGDLQGLHVLNLSHNALTGQIPSSIGNMKQLESLDLSVNHLSGRIPQELASLTFLEVLNVSNNNLVGRIPQSTQISTFSNTSFGGNPGLCGKPLSKLCDNATQNRTNEVAQSKDAGSFSRYVIKLGLFVGLGFGVGFALVLVLQNIPLRFWKKHDRN